MSEKDRKEGRGERKGGREGGKEGGWKGLTIKELVIGSLHNQLRKQVLVT